MVKERWWRTRTWLVAVILVAPFAIAGGAAVVGGFLRPPTGCDESSRAILEREAGLLAGRVPGLQLGQYDSADCDSGSSATIAWVFESSTPFSTAALAAGCTETYRDQWTHDFHAWLCRPGESELLVALTRTAQNTSEGTVAFDQQ